MRSQGDELVVDWDGEWKMLGIELLELAGKVRELRSGAQTVEVRQGSASRLYDTIPAFGSRQGGTIIFGLDAERQYEVTGVGDVRSLEESILGQCREIVPEGRPLFTSAVMDGKTICSAEIPAAGVRERPCFYSGKVRTGGAFVRSAERISPCRSLSSTPMTL